MIRVLYSYQVKAGMEKDFTDAWARVIRTIKTTYKGSRGALLTRDYNDKQQFIAVARWETPQDFKKFHDIGLAGSEAQKTLNATLDMPVALQVVEELSDLTVYDPNVATK
jgi:heme-degrading monooxygenase HmoA